MPWGHVELTVKTVTRQWWHSCGSTYDAKSGIVYFKHRAYKDKKQCTAHKNNKESNNNKLEVQKQRNLDQNPSNPLNYLLKKINMFNHGVSLEEEGRAHARWSRDR